MNWFMVTFSLKGVIILLILLYKSYQTGKWLIKYKEYSQRLGLHKMHQIFSIAKSTVNLFILTCTGRDVLCWITLCYVKHIKWSKGMKINVWQDKETDYSGVWVDRFYCTIKSVVWDATVYKGHWPLRFDVCTVNIQNSSSFKLLYYVTYFTPLSSLCTLLTPKTKQEIICHTSTHTGRPIHKMKGYRWNRFWLDSTC